MFESKILDVFIGLAFTYLMYSLMATTIREAIAGLLDQRARTLYKGIKSMLSNTKDYPNLLAKYIDVLLSFGRKRIRWVQSLWRYKASNQFYDKFYDHPIIKNFGQNRFFTKPSYINPKNFGSILTETAKNSIVDAAGTIVYKDAPISPNHINEFLALCGVKNNYPIPEGHRLNATVDEDFVQILNFSFLEADQKIDVLRDKLESWFNDTMDRVSGWYKRNNQVWLLVIGLSLALVFNVDSIELTNTLLRNNKAREQLAAMAQISLQKSEGNQNSLDFEIIDKAYGKVKSEINEINGLIGFGWNDFGRHDTLIARQTAELALPISSSLFDHINPFFYLKKSIYNSTESLRKYKYSKEDSLLNQQKYIDYVKNVPELYSKNKPFIDSLDENVNPNTPTFTNRKLVVLYNDIVIDHNFTTHLQWFFYKKLTLQKILGFLITAIAISLGGPFWFDLLSKVVKMRSTGNKAKVEK